MNKPKQLSIFVNGETRGVLYKEEYLALELLAKHINTNYPDKDMNIIIGKNSVEFGLATSAMRRNQIKREGIKINLQIAAIVLAMVTIVIILLQRLCQL